MTTLVDAAAEYLNAGLEIVALAGKKPHPGLHPQDWTNDPIRADGPLSVEDMAVLQRALETKGVTGIGILVPEHVYVLDVDTDEAADKFNELAGGLPDTAVAKTKHGLHIWYWAPGAMKSTWIGPLLLRGRGSQVVAPPSAHPSGGTYEWLEPLIVNGHFCVDPLPQGFVRRLESIEKVEDTRARGEVAGWMRLVLEDGKVRAEPYLDRIIAKVAGAEEGSRNGLLSWGAMQMRDQGVPLEVTERLLREAATAAGLPAHEIAYTIRAAYRRSRREP